MTTRHPSPWGRSAALAAVLVVAACASTPEPHPRVEAARTSLQQAKAAPARAELAAVELERADEALSRAERALRSGADRREIDHLALVAQRQVDLAMAAGERKATEQSLERIGRERDAIQLEASRRQTDAAQARATTAQLQAADLANRNTALETEAAQARVRADALAGRLQAMQAQQTERGLIVTFSDVLFDVGQARLRPGAQVRVEQLAAVLREYTDRNVLIEGFTDSTGSQATNQELSERRAMAVRNALIARGIAANRIVARGHAERYPVADNDSAAGRQQNRRVEAVLSDDKGQLPMRP